MNEQQILIAAFDGKNERGEWRIEAISPSLYQWLLATDKHYAKIYRLRSDRNLDEAKYKLFKVMIHRYNIRPSGGW